MNLYGVDAAYPDNLTLAALDLMQNPAPNWVLVYVGGPTNGGHWTVSDKTDRATRYRTVPCYVGQNDLIQSDGTIYHTGTYTVAQAEIDAADALTSLAAYGYTDGAYWLDTEYVTYQNSKLPVLDYIDEFHKIMYAHGYLPGQYGSKPLLSDYHPSVPCGAAVAQWIVAQQTSPPLSDMPLPADVQARYAFLAWQYANRGGYDVSVADDRMFPTGDAPATMSTGLPGTLYQLSDATEARFFTDTGYSIAHGFRAFWEKFGMPEQGLLLFGYPISREYVRMFPTGEAYNCQMFERARFEWHPHSNPDLFDVELGLVGSLVVERTNEAQTYPAAFVKENPPV